MSQEEFVKHALSDIAARLHNAITEGSVAVICVDRGVFGEMAVGAFDVYGGD